MGLKTKHLSCGIVGLFISTFLVANPLSSSAEDGAVKRTLDATGPQCLALPNNIRIWFNDQQPTSLATSPDPILVQALNTTRLQGSDPISVTKAMLASFQDSVHIVEGIYRSKKGGRYKFQFSPSTLFFTLIEPNVLPDNERTFLHDGKGLVEVSPLLKAIWERQWNSPTLYVAHNQELINLQFQGLVSLMQGTLAYVKTLKPSQLPQANGYVPLPILSAELGAALITHIEAKLNRLTNALPLFKTNPNDANAALKEFFPGGPNADDMDDVLQVYGLTDLEFWLLRDALKKQVGNYHPLVRRMTRNIRNLALISEVLVLRQIKPTWQGWLAHSNHKPLSRMNLLASPLFNPDRPAWRQDTVTVFRLDYEGWSNGFFSYGSDFGKDLRRSRRIFQEDPLAVLAYRHADLKVGEFTPTTPFGDDTGSIEVPTFRTPFVGTSLGANVVFELYDEKLEKDHRIYVLRIPKRSGPYVYNYWNGNGQEFEVLMVHRSLPEWHRADIPAEVFTGGIAPPPYHTRTPYDLTINLPGRIIQFKTFRDNLPATVRKKVDREMLIRLYLDPKEFQRARKDSPHPQWVNGIGAWKGWLEAQALIADLSGSGRGIPITPKYLSQIHRLVLKYMTTNEQGTLTETERQRRRSPSFMKDYRMVFDMPEITPVTQFALEEVNLTRVEPLEAGGFDVYLAPAVEIPMRLEETTTLINEKILDTQAPYQAARVWRRYVAAGSFWDGNGRMGRLLRDLILVRHRMVPALMDHPTEDLTVPDIQLELRIIRGMHRYMNTYRGLANQLMQNDE